MTDIEKLREVALDQHGLITTAQAQEAGVSRPSLAYLSKHQRIERVERGIYRIPQVQRTAYEALQLALLWAGEDSFLSHDTALAAWDVCDINPMVVHISVPEAKRIQKTPPSYIAIHKVPSPQSQIKWWEGMPIASLKLALAQCIDRGVSSHLVDQALQNGVSRGMIRDEDVVELQAKMEECHGR